MIFDGPVLGWLCLALLPILVPVLLAVVLKRFLNVSGGCLSLVILLVVGLVGVFGIGTYLNSGGTVVRAEVLRKTESLVYHLDGSWNRKAVVQVSYKPTETADVTSKVLDVRPARYDEINQGDFVELRCPSKAGTLQIIRLNNQNVLPQIWYWLTNQPFVFCFILGIVLVLGVRFMSQASLPTLFLLSGVVTVGAWWMANVGIPWWDEVMTLFGSLNSVNATVREVHPPYLGSGLQRWISTSIYQPTDLILLDILPLGHTDPILSVDEVDLGSAGLRPGQSVSAEYSAADSRHSIVPDATRSFVWKNGLINTLLAGLALFGVARVSRLIRGQSQNRSSARVRSRRSTSTA